MTKKLALILTIIFLSLSANDGLSQNTKSDDLRLKSFKNWFTRDFKIPDGTVTMDDLLKGPGTNWLLYHGDFGANHYSPLSGININNIQKLVPKWTYKITDGANLRSSPIVYRGVMYVTAANEIHAIDTATGQWLWIWQAYEERSAGINRGVAIYGDRLFFSTIDCRLVALNIKDGNVAWSVKYAEPEKGYYSTMAPLVIKDRIVIGISNFNQGERGFIASFSASEGKELWRFWTLPEISGLLGAPTWMTGSYDYITDTIYWPIGTLSDNQRTDRKIYRPPGSYNDSIVALNPNNGRLKWSVRLGEYLPISWDSNEPLVLTRLGGKNIILQANRNGMLYKIDRQNGEMLMSKPFVEKLDWQTDFPCPSAWGATNWMPPSLSPITGLLYVMTLEGCVNEENLFFLKSIDPLNLNVRWSYPVRGTNTAAPGVLATGGNIILSSEGSGHIVALDAFSGKKLWDFSTGRPMFAAPVTYMVNGNQYISLVTGSDVYTFGLYSAQ